MKSVANENDVAGKKLPQGPVTGPIPAQQDGNEPAHLEITWQISRKTNGEKPARLEISWHTAPEQSIAIIDLTGKCGPTEFPVLPAAAVSPAPSECCYL